MATAGPPPSDQLEVLRAALGAQYDVERVLGRGGMGAVYLGRDKTLDRPVAIKVINPEVASSASLRERFLQEARTVARLRHPNIVSVHAAGESNGLLYFVMEFVPGESLRELLAREQRLGGERAAEIIRGIALALDHAHALGLVHRDVKPENILIDGDSGRAMLTDFGVARAFESDGGMTQTGMILGSPRYMSPEQASGDRAIDGRSDLYSLALVAYEMYAGVPVVQSGTAASMLVKHLTETPAPLANAAAGIEPHIGDAIDRALAKDPDQRWQTGREFAEAMAGGALTPSGELRGARSGATATVATTATVTRRVPIGLVAGIAVLVIAGALLAPRWLRPVGTAYLVTPFEIQSGDPSVGWLREGSVNMLTLTLGQWRDLNVVDYERTLSLLDAADLGEKERLSLDDALGLARRANAGTVVTGQVQTIRDSLLVVAKLYDVRTGRARNQAQQGIRLGDDPRPLYDRLSRDLLNIAGLDAASSTTDLAAATSTSLEAYRAYLDGVKALNGWRLAEADAAFARAIAIDSTFALAHHKRSLGLGWSEVGGPAYVAAAERAHELAGRLPPRERALVHGHHHLVRGLGALNAGAPARAQFDSAIATYATLLERDSLVAEAWYGLADSYYHARGQNPPLDTTLAYTTRSLRAFRRTLAIDSSFHLAYSHLVQLYNAAGLPQSRVLLSGDSAVALPSPAPDSASPAGLAAQRLRESAQRRGIETARAWSRADSRSSQPIIQLAQSFVSAGQRDSAMAALRASVGAQVAGAPAVRLTLLALEVQSGDSGVAGTLRYILDSYTADSLRQVGIGQRFGLLGAMMAATGVTGRTADLDRATELFNATDPTLPFSAVPTAPITDLHRRLIRVAMGAPLTPETHRELVAGMRNIDTLSGPVGEQGRAGSQSIHMLAFLATRDTTFAHYLRKWTGAEWPEFDALIALQRGDTATAERIVQQFPAPDSLRNPNVRFGAGGMRTIARAEILASLGLTRQAAETYEAIDVSRVNQGALADPGYTVLVRSLLTRARLWRQLGETARAAAAYEEFIARWANADGPAAAQVAEARRELSQLGDQPAARSAGRE